MIPSPPIWKRDMITTYPKKVKSLAVSTTISPVTHKVEVAVKNASNQTYPICGRSW
jgi:hypothetical protein